VLPRFRDFAGQFQFACNPTPSIVVPW